MKTQTTSLADVFILENGIQKEVWKVRELMNVEDIQEHSKIYEANTREDLLILIDSSSVKKMSKPVRDFLGTFSTTPQPVAVALKVGSGLSRIGGNLFLRFNKPKNYPIKLFTNEEKAIKWLLSILAQKVFFYKNQIKLNLWKLTKRL